MDHATFTLRDLNRQPAKVLKTCDQLGIVRIRTRSGKTYALTLEPVRAKKGSPPDFAARRAHLRKLGYQPPTPREAARLDRIIAGEE